MNFAFALITAYVMSHKNEQTNDAFAARQDRGFLMLIGMATTLVAFAIVVATSLPVSSGIKLSAMDADEVAAQLATSDDATN